MLTSFGIITRMASNATNLKKAGLKTLGNLTFDNKALKVLPIDKEKKNFIRQVPNSCFSYVSPTEVKNPRMVGYSVDAMKLLDISKEQMEDSEATHYFSGNKILPGSQTAAHCYCGHQFGAFSGQLGDGTVTYLGEVINSKLERWEIHLKGAGPTPYSRHSDGRKVLRSSIREFLCSEVMYYLGIPTTRAGTIVTSDTMVIRDKLYDGHAKHERCSLVLRLAPSFIRFGSFEICKPEDPMTGRSGPSVGNVDILKVLLNYVIETFFPKIWGTKGTRPVESVYLEWFKEVVQRTARLVAAWQCVGWCHGVLNTDNMSIVGLTIDYGPFGFIDRYDPNFICNASDDGGRYAYAKQPEICKWNCKKLAEALKDHIPLEESLKILEESYQSTFDFHYMDTMKKKLGIIKSNDSSDSHLVTAFLSTMHETGADFTNSWRALCDLPYKFDMDTAVDKLLAQCCSVEELRDSYKPNMNQRDLQMMLMLAQSNPGLLQHLGRGAMRLIRELDNMEKLNELKDITNESKLEKDKGLWKEWLTRYYSRLDMDLEASKLCEAIANRERSNIMNSVNPRFVLRNHLAEEVIEQAENNDFSGVQNLLNAFKSVYRCNDDKTDTGAGAPVEIESMNLHYGAKPPSWASSIKVS